MQNKLISDTHGLDMMVLYIFLWQFLQGGICSVSTFWWGEKISSSKKFKFSCLWIQGILMIHPEMLVYIQYLVLWYGEKCVLRLSNNVYLLLQVQFLIPNCNFSLSVLYSLKILVLENNWCNYKYENRSVKVIWRMYV